VADWLSSGYSVDSGLTGLTCGGVCCGQWTIVRIPRWIRGVLTSHQYSHYSVFFSTEFGYLAKSVLLFSFSTEFGHLAKSRSIDFTKFRTNQSVESDFGTDYPNLDIRHPTRQIHGIRLQNPRVFNLNNNYMDSMQFQDCNLKNTVDPCKTT
jgi:hypothetical protein